MTRVLIWLADAIIQKILYKKRLCWIIEGNWDLKPKETDWVRCWCESVSSEGGCLLVAGSEILSYTLEMSPSPFGCVGLLDL